MKIKTRVAILDYEGNPLKQDGSEDHLTFFDVFFRSLNGSIPGEMMPAEQKNRVYQITTKMYRSDEPNFTPEELSLIKDRVGKSFAPVVVGRVTELLDGKEDNEPEVLSKD